MTGLELVSVLGISFFAIFISVLMAFVMMKQSEFDKE
ncbi:hypothetical protein B0H94_101181 [Salsuginibacillus halophilus]|uniref:Uncharacterized protein n=1 Tax=Salsuginibacillus halophilus TaxID=517424 RepID=A0A2P8HYG8_9BACI|nr:hypothetical protein B0H94_101181 [Salsuginibacillus halophilus]